MLRTRLPLIWRSCAARCTLLFFSACLIHTLGRELARGLVAASLGMPATVYPYFAAYAIPPETSAQALWITLSPMAFSAALASLGAGLYQTVRSAAARLFTLYLAGFGATAVAAGLLLASSEGSLHAVLTFLDVPKALQITVSITGGLLLLLAMWMAGERLQPTTSTLLVPFLATMAARTLVLAPLPWQVAVVMIYGSSYWLLAAVFGYWHRRRTGVAEAPEGPLNLASSAVTLPILLIVVARTLVGGVRFE